MARFSEAATAVNNRTTIDLGGAGQTTGGIDFFGGPASYTIGLTGQELRLRQNAEIFLRANPTNDQTIEADLILGDGGTAGFNDEINIRNLSTTASLILNGNIDTGTGGPTPGETQRLVLGQINKQDNETITVNGNINNTGAASGIDIFVAGSDTTLSRDILAGSNQVKTFERDDATFTVNGDLKTGRFEVRYGTVNINANQTFENNLFFGQGNQGDGDATMNIDSGATVHQKSLLRYIADETTANTASIDGGTLQITGSSQSFNIDDNTSGSLFDPSEAEMTVTSNITENGGHNLVKVGSGTLKLDPTSGSNSYNALNINEGRVQITKEGSLGSQFGQRIGFGTTTATLEYVGTGSSINKNFTLGNNNAAGDQMGSGVFLANGSGAVTFTTNNFNNLRSDVTVARTVTLGGANTDDNTIEGVVRDHNAGTGLINLEKVGTGKWILEGTNTYTGTTVVKDGTLVIDGDNTSATGNITVENGGTLTVGNNGILGGDLTVDEGGVVDGTGTINGAVTISGVHRPGNSPGVQTFAGDLNYDGTNPTVEWELTDDVEGSVIQGGTPVFDQIDVGGNLNFLAGTTLELDFNSTGSAVDWTTAFWDTEREWLLYDVAGSTTGFSNFSLSVINWDDSQSQSFDTEIPLGRFNLQQRGSDIFLTFAPVPEPSTVLVLLGLFGSALFRRGRRSLATDASEG